MSRRAVLATLLVAATAGAQQPPPVPAPLTLPDDWAARDLEGRWVAYRRDLEQHPQDKDRGKRWAERLGELREFELLEWIGLYEGYRFAGPVLRRADAPQLFRVALWNLGALDSHNKDNAQKALLEGGGLALGWFERHPEAQRGRAAAIYEQLRASGAVATDPAPMLPPLDPVQFLVPQLDVPAELAEFGDRTRAEAKVRYVHQVLRALDGVLVWGEADEMHAHKILALMRHGSATVRSAAARTLCAMPGELVPWEPLLRMADRPGDDAARRLAATVLSFSRHPRAFYELHRLAGDAAHPGAEVLVERLGDVGDAYTVAVFTEWIVAAAGARQQRLADAAGKIQARLRAEDLGGSPQIARAYLERLAWLRSAGDPREPAAVAATAAQLRTKLGATLGPVLDAALALTPRSALRGDERAAVARALQDLAAELKGATGR